MIGKIPDLTVASSGVNADPCACRSYFCATGVVCLDWRQSCTVFLSVVLQTLRINHRALATVLLLTVQHLPFHRGKNKNNTTAAG